MSGIRTWVIVPGFQIKDIPIVTALDGGDSHTTNMLYMKHISPSIPPPQDYYTSYLTSACSFPNTSSMEAASCPTTRDFDHMYVRYELSSLKLKKTSTNHILQLVTCGHLRPDGREGPPEGDAGHPSGPDPAAGEAYIVLFSVPVKIFVICFSSPRPLSPGTSS